MQSNKLRMAIRATAAAAILGTAAQAQAFNFSAGDVDASVYGYARLNMSYDMDENVANTVQSGGFPTIPNNDVAEGHFGASAAQSRLGVRATNSDGVTVNVEGDFYGGNGFRLRHAYGSYKGILAGQTWSNYSSFVGNTPTLDFSSGPGLAGYQSRTAQLRYTTGPVSVSIEDPQTRGITDSRDSTPAFTARFEDSAGGLSYSTAAVVKQGTSDDGTQDDSVMGYAVFGAAKLAVTNMISIQGAVNYSDGANGYLYRSGGDDVYVDGNGDLESLSGIGGALGASFDLGSGRSINVMHGMTQLDVDDLNDPNATETNQATFVNYRWTPVKNVMMGVEYARWATEDQGGDDADANRLMFAAQYNF